jgi:hypothetical protein
MNFILKIQADDARLQILLRRAFFTCVIGVTLLVYISITTHAFSSAPIRTFGFDSLAAGFLKGHAYIGEVPARALREAHHPWEKCNIQHWHWDLLYFEGRYYLYWGPMPALVALVGKLLSGGGRIADSALVFFFAVGRLLFGAALIHQIHRRCFLNAPFWTVGAGIIVFGLATPIPNILARPYVYEVAIIAGQCFLVGGALLTFLALSKERNQRSQTLALVGAALLLGMAFACRLTLAIGVGMLVLATIIALILKDRATGSYLTQYRRPVLALSLPIVAALLALSIYNFTRFGSPFDFGIRYQLTTDPFRTGIEYVPYNLVQYLLRPLNMLRYFPFVQPSTLGQTDFFLIPENYFSYAEPVSGMIYATPFFLFAAGLAIVLKTRFVMHGWPNSMKLERTWVYACALSTSAATFGPLLLLFCSTNRYFADGILGLTILSMSGAWLTLENLNGLSRKILLTSYFALAMISAIIGTFSGIPA